MGEKRTKHDTKISVVGLFHEEADMQRAIVALRAAGFTDSDISALVPDASAHPTAFEKHTKAPEGAATGGIAGVLTGGTAGLLVGLGVIAIPGLGPLLAAGPIIAALAGAGLFGTFGSVTGALIGMGIPEYEAKRYESFVAKGGSLLSVHSDSADQARRARSILDGFGGSNIGKQREVHPRQKHPSRT
ncbi:MAG TPA: hypothetical protein VM513_32840 [Kofleriaceae bacterium]|jgi:hypothetical protein|nr:hypothetical protein [Kofleriaceae bacterium]